MKRLRTILIADDEPIVRNLIAMVLSREGYSVLEADTAAEALALSSNCEGIIDLLIADHSLKTMMGWQVAEKMCEARPDLKILYISGYPLEKLAQEGGLGIATNAKFLAKPFSQEALIIKIREILQPPWQP
jgi:CheY-like chemotaxis protein